MEAFKAEIKKIRIKDREENRQEQRTIKEGNNERGKPNQETKGKTGKK